jgi:hypothetical protein
MFNLCAPSIIYLIFSITQILIDIFKGLYNTAMMKIIVTIMVTLLLNIMCERGLTVVSWIIVFIPFILMTVVVSVLLYIFGLDVATGKFKDHNKKSEANKNITCGKGVTVDKSGDVIVYDPYYNPLTHPIYFDSPNIIIPNPYENVSNKVDASNSNKTGVVPHGTSSIAYKSWLGF